MNLRSSLFAVLGVSAASTDPKAVPLISLLPRCYAQIPDKVHI